MSYRTSGITNFVVEAAEPRLLTAYARFAKSLKQPCLDWLRSGGQLTPNEVLDLLVCSAWPVRALR